MLAAIPDVLFARWQMGLSLAFHIVFATIGIGMPLLMVVAEWRWIRTGRRAYLDLAHHWAKGTAVFFAVGAVSGTVLSFELGLLWPAFMDRFGGVIGFPFQLEGFAFFAEAIFLGLYLYGWDRINRWMHLLSGVIVALSGLASAAFVIMVNGWMNSPVGFEVDPATGGLTDVDPVAAMFNPAWATQTVHMLVAAYLATAFGAAGIHARQMLRDPGNELHRKALAVTMSVGAVCAFLQPLTGDRSAKMVAETQPVKFAAMEGQFRSEAGAPLRVGGIPVEEERRTPYALEIPGLLSFLGHGSFDAEVQGLEGFPEDEWPPVAIVHIAFQIMVGIGLLLVAVATWFAVAAWRAGRVPDGPRLMRCLVFTAPMGFIAIEAGWIVTEVGRQPWIVQGVMRTEDAVTPMPGLWIPCLVFTAVYLGLSAFVAIVIRHQVRPTEPERSE